MTAKEARTSLMLALPGLVMAVSGFLMRRDAIEGGHAVGLILLVAGVLFLIIGGAQFAKAATAGR
jgi:hypothetical protein